jgi:glucokinase
MSRTPANAIIGVDVGATTIAAGLVTPAGEVLHAIQRPTHAAGPGTALPALRGLVRGLVAEAGGQGLALAGIGIGVAGVVDTAKGAMQSHPFNNLPDLANVSLIDELRELTDAPVFVDNDANAQALAEWLFGVGRGAHSLVVLAIGTGVGGGIILADALVRGATGYAGELHALPIAFDGARCRCGVRGCLGSYVEGPAIAAAARDRLSGGAPSALSRATGGDLSRLTPELVFQAAAAGDALAQTIVAEVCEALGAGIAAIVSALDPEVVVVTGGVARSLVPLTVDLRRCVEAYTLAHRPIGGTRIHVIGGDKRRTVRGGAALVLYELNRASASPSRRREDGMPNDLVEREG